MVCGAEQRRVGGGRFLPDDRQIVDHSERGTEHRFAGAIGDGHGVVGTLEGDVVIGERPKAWGDRRRLGLSDRFGDDVDVHGFECGTPVRGCGQRTATSVSALGRTRTCAHGSGGRCSIR